MIGHYPEEFTNAKTGKRDLMCVCGHYPLPCPHEAQGVVAPKVAGPAVKGWDEYFIDLLGPIASRSKDPRTKTGCIIVGPKHEIRTTGYNGFPRGVADTLAERWNRENGEKYFWVEHAERNAIYNAARYGTALEGCILYCSWLPCMDCARAIIQSGIGSVVIDKAQHEANKSPKWDADFARVGTMLAEGGVELRWYRRTA